MMSGSTEHAPLSSATPISTLSYQSRAAGLPTDDDMEALLDQARARNHALGVTGMLVYERGRFFQWLEGPSDSLSDLWRSLHNDVRHGEIEIVAEGVAPVRLFADWDMQYLTRRADAEEAMAAVEAQTHGLDHIRVTLAKLAIAGDDPAIADLLAAEIGHQETIRSVCRHLIEPAARLLGDWWGDDRCTGLELTLALSHLQIAVRRLSESEAQGRSPPDGPRAILIAPAPNEPHQLGVTLVSSFFRQSGWAVQVEFPPTNADLHALVRDQWYDVLSLTLSDALRRKERLAEMAGAIRATRKASRNPDLLVIVGGRAFFEKPDVAAANVGADVGYSSAAEAVEITDLTLDLRDRQAKSGPGPSPSSTKPDMTNGVPGPLPKGWFKLH
jgi:methanogenic corrinoid protein MtbC1